MFQKLDKISYSSFLRGKRSEFPLINAVINSQQEGAVFINRKSGAFFILHKAALGELFELTKEAEIEHFLNFCLHEDSIPKYFHIYNASYFLLKALKSPTNYNFKIRERIQLVHPGNQVSSTEKENLPTGYKICTITADNFQALEIFNLQLQGKFWGSEKDFLTNGFGAIVTNELNAPIALCYAACLSNGKAEIDVITLPEYQKKGFAKTCVQSFLEQCSKREILANWDCFMENTGSLKTAKNCNFKENFSYSFLSLYKNN